MIQDIAPHIYHNEYLPHHPQKDSVLLCYDKDRIFVVVDRKSTRLNSSHCD